MLLVELILYACSIHKVLLITHTDRAWGTVAITRGTKGQDLTEGQD